MHPKRTFENVRVVYYSYVLPVKGVVSFDLAINGTGTEYEPCRICALSLHREVGVVRHYHKHFYPLPLSPSSNLTFQSRLIFNYIIRCLWIIQQVRFKIAVHSAKGCCTATTMALSFYWIGLVASMLVGSVNSISLWLDQFSHLSVCARNVCILWITILHYVSHWLRLQIIVNFT